MRERAGLLALVLALAGCAAAPPSPLGRDQVARLRLDQVSVTMAPDAAVSWGAAEDEYVKSKAAELPAAKLKQPVQETASLASPASATDAQYAALVASPEAKAFVRDRAASRLKTAFEESVKPAVQAGTQPVRLEITVKSFQVPSALQRVIVGGQPTVLASIELKDAATGAVLASRPDFGTTAYAGNGWGGVLLDQAMDDLDVRLTKAAAETYRDWLVGKSA